MLSKGLETLSANTKAAARMAPGKSQPHLTLPGTRMTDKGDPCPCQKWPALVLDARSRSHWQREGCGKREPRQREPSSACSQARQAEVAPLHTPLPSPSRSPPPPRPAPASHLGPLLQVPLVHTPTSKASVLPAQAPSCALTDPEETTLTGSVDRERCQNSSAARWSYAKKTFRQLREAPARWGS